MALVLTLLNFDRLFKVNYNACGVGNGGFLS